MMSYDVYNDRLYAWMILDVLVWLEIEEMHFDIWNKSGLSLRKHHMM